MEFDKGLTMCVISHKGLVVCDLNEGKKAYFRFYRG